MNNAIKDETARLIALAILALICLAVAIGNW